MMHVLFMAALSLDIFAAQPDVSLTYDSCDAAPGSTEHAIASSISDNKANCPAPVENGSLAPASSVEPLVSELQLPAACVLASLRSTLMNGSRFATCVNGKVVGNHEPKPCVSERYHRFIYSSYLNAMRCLGLDPRELFGLINLESSFHIGILSHTGAVGVGQLTTSAVWAINHQGKLKKFVTKPECEALKDVLSRPLPNKRSCDWISVPENPSQGFLYAGAGYLIFRDLAAKLIKGRPAFAGISQSDRRRLLFDLAAYMYNGGDSGVKRIFEEYIAASEGAKISYKTFKAEFSNALLMRFGKDLPFYQSNPKALEAKRREIAAYVSGIEGKLRATEKAAGAKCSM